MLTYTFEQTKYKRAFCKAQCLSTDTKPTGDINGIYIKNGSRLYEIDTGKKFLYDQENAQWCEVAAGGSSSGGSSSDSESSDVMTVMLRYEDVGGGDYTTYCDHTYEQIYNALTNNQQVKFFYGLNLQQGVTYATFTPALRYDIYTAEHSSPSIVVQFLQIQENGQQSIQFSISESSGDDIIQLSTFTF